jgi:hypothetical protein
MRGKQGLKMTIELVSNNIYYQEVSYYVESLVLHFATQLIKM